MRSSALRPALTVLVLGAAALVALATTARSAEAKPLKKYYFEVADVTADEAIDKKAAAEIVPVATKQVETSIGSHEQLVTSLEGAPDREKGKQFKAWLKKKKLSGAYRMNVEVIAFEEEVEDKDDSLNKEKRLIVRVSLRTFGETIPDRVMGFTGEGSATVKLDIGKKLRPRDREYAIQQAFELAMTDALASSLTKLAAPPPKPKK